MKVFGQFVYQTSESRIKADEQNGMEITTEESKHSM
jgi:hypothetical protein